MIIDFLFLKIQAYYFYLLNHKNYNIKIYIKIEINIKVIYLEFIKFYLYIS